MGMLMSSRGREQLEWTQSVWDSIDQAVHDEAKRTKIAAQFLPLYSAEIDARTIQSDAVILAPAPVLTVNEADETRIIEIWTEFALTKTQYSQEEDLKTAVTLAITAANRLSRAEDSLIFQGDAGLNDGLFTSNTVQVRSRFPIVGLLPSAPDAQVFPVFPTVQDDDPNQNRYQENTFGQVARGYSVLQRTHYGRDALVLPTNPFADTWAPIATTLIMPADRIKGLVEERFYSTSTLPNEFAEGRTPQGVLVALDGNTMDLVMGLAPTTEFMQIDAGQYRFRVFERFALRLKDPRAVVRLEFQPKKKE